MNHLVNGLTVGLTFSSLEPTERRVLLGLTVSRFGAITPTVIPSSQKNWHIGRACPTDDEHAAVAALLRRTVAEDKFPFSPRLAPLKSALAKLVPQPEKPRRELPPLPSGPMVGKPEEGEAVIRLRDLPPQFREQLSRARKQDRAVAGGVSRRRLQQRCQRGGARDRGTQRVDRRLAASDAGCGWQNSQQTIRKINDDRKAR
jgi:hypothetical protein